MYQIQVQRSGQSFLLTMPSQSHTQFLDVNKKHVLRPRCDHILLLPYTICCLPLAWHHHLQKRHTFQKDEPLTSNTAAGATGASSRSFYLAGAPTPHLLQGLAVTSSPLHSSWRIVFSLWEPPHLEMPGRLHPRPMTNWLRGIKAQSPCFQCRTSSVVQIVHHSSPMGQAEASLQLYNIFAWLLSLPYPASLISLQVSPRSTPSINHRHRNPHLRLWF